MFVPPTHVLNVINGNIVALCGIDIQDDDPQRNEATSGPRILDRLPLCPCYGFGENISHFSCESITVLNASKQQFLCTQESLEESTWNGKKCL